MKVEKLYKLYDKFNAELFDSALPYVDIRITKNKEVYGEVVYDSTKLYYIKIRKEPKYTLLHEMVHVWQFTKGKKLKHDTAFCNKVEEIAKKLNVKASKIL